MSTIALKTLFIKEIRRFSKVWLQTVLSPLVTTSTTLSPTGPHIILANGTIVGQSTRLRSHRCGLVASINLSLLHATFWRENRVQTANA